jgi:hypothetical protein
METHINNLKIKGWEPLINMTWLDDVLKIKQNN